MIDYDDLMAAVHAQDEPAVAKILDKLDRGELDDVKTDSYLLSAAATAIIRYKEKYKVSFPASGIE